jgi:hypothetical protein
MTIPVSLGEARLVDENPGQNQSPDANAKGDLFYIYSMSLRGRRTSARSNLLTELEIASLGWVSVRARKSLALLDQQPSSQ